MLKIVSNYTLTQYISKGQYGKVYKAINHETSQYLAIKMIDLDKFIQNPKLIKLTQQQIQLLSKLQSNENIIKFKEIIKSNRYLYLIYEYCNNGTLQEYLSKKGMLGEKEAIKLFKQLINGYKSLYQNNIIHRDIKPDNILFKNQVLKLADFGFCKKLKFNDDLTQTSLGSPLYMAPQVLNHDVYGTKADLWSCGIILYQMLFGRCPYGTCNMKELLTHYSNKDDIFLPQQKIFLSQTLIQMLKRILCKDQFKRISWQQFLYEYSFTDSGQIKHKQKDFQYDLMKLMKRNSSGKEQQGNGKPSQNKTIKFDWTRITDTNSSVHSQQCNNQKQKSPSSRPSTQQMYSTYSISQYSYPNSSQFQQNRNYSSYSSNMNLINQQKQKQISEIYQLKKTIKSFQQQHSKIFQLLTIIQSLLQTTKQYEYDSRIVYFLVYNVEYLLQQNIQKISTYLERNNLFLNSFNQQRTKLEKMKRLFVAQNQNIKPKINSIKIDLLTLEEVGQEVFKYPKKEVLRKILAEYIQNYQLQAEDVLSLTEQNHREEAIRLLKIIWGVELIYSKNKEDISSDKNSLQNKSKSTSFNYDSILSIKQQTPKRQISALINRYLVRIGI